MAEPHHHVFNALQQGITKSVNVKEVVKQLAKKNIIKEEEIYTSKNGMKRLVAFLRNKKYETFLEFVDSIFLAEKELSSMDQSVPIIDSIIMAVQDFDQRNSTTHADKIIEIQNKYMKKQVVVEEIHGGSPGSETQLSSNPETGHEAVLSSKGLFDMPNLCYIEEPIHRSFQSDGGVLDLEDYNFSLTVPPLAVLEGQEIKLKVGICYCGPFSISEDYLIASDFIVIVADDKFSKPVKVSMEHCLCLPEYKKCNEVVILRASHTKITEDGLFTFDVFTNPEIASDFPSLSFETEEFCILCAVLKEDLRDRASSTSSTSSLSRKINQVHIDDDNPSSAPSSFDDETCPSRVERSFSAESHSESVRESDDLSQTTAKRKPYSLRQRNSGSSFERTPSVSPQKGTQQKRTAIKRPLRDDSIGEKRYRYGNVEYAAILIQPQKRTIDPYLNEYNFVIFISTNCPSANKICMQHAKAILKSNDIYTATIPISFDTTIKLDANTTSPGWDVFSDKTATVTLPEVQFHKMNRSDLFERIKQDTCPPRIIFTAESGEGANAKLSCTVTIRNALKTETQDDVFFRITALRSPPSSAERVGVQRQDAMDYYCQQHSYPHQPPSSFTYPPQYNLPHQPCAYYAPPPPHHTHYQENIPPGCFPSAGNHCFNGSQGIFSQPVELLNSPSLQQARTIVPYYSELSQGSIELSQNYDSPLMVRQSPSFTRVCSTEDERDGALTSLTGSYELNHESEYQLNQEEMDMVVSEKFEYALSRYLKKWKHTARFGFGLTEVDVEHLMNDYSYTNEQGYQAYRKWKMQEGKISVTVGELLDILYKSSETEAIEALLKDIRK